MREPAVATGAQTRGVLARLRESLDARHVLILMGLAAVVLGGQIQNEVFYSVDGVVYAVVGKELLARPLRQWVLLTWNGVPFFEHPHLTPWLLALSMKVLGVSTLAVLAPIVLISIATVLLTYLLGRRLIDHRFGLLAGTMLVLTPQFIRGARNPMLEPALMCCVMLAVFFHLDAARPRRFLGATLLTGLSLGLAALAKGPPAALAVAVILAFQAAAVVWPAAFASWRLPPGRLLVHIGIVLGVAAGVVLLVDLWHRSVGGSSFLMQYAGHQLTYTVVEGRGAATNHWAYYLTTFVNDWPWWPLAVASVVVVARGGDRKALPALVLGGAVTVGTYLGFSLMLHKAEWYTNIHFVGSSLLAALTARHVVSERALARFYAPVVLVPATIMVLLSATVPSLFLQYGRPLERFLDRAQASGLAATLGGRPLADCIGVEPWRGPFFLRFYLGVPKTDCGDPSASFALIDNRTAVMDAGQRLVFSQQPYSIIERAGHP